MLAFIMQLAIMSDFIWVEKYRPTTIDECILPKSIKTNFQDFVDRGEIPNMLLSGPPGIGKTTVAKALCNQLGADYYVINGSDEGRFLDTVRTTQRTSHLPSLLQVSRNIKSLSLTKQTIPLPMYSSFSERLLRSSPKTAGLSLRVTYKNKIIDPLHSRCTVVDFSINKKDKPTIAAQFFSRLTNILETDKKVVAQLINQSFS